MAKDEGTYEFHGRVVAESHVAWLVDMGEAEVWIPKSQVVASADELKIGVETEIEIPTWLAEKVGVV